MNSQLMELTTRPIIGILSVDIPPNIKKELNATAQSNIPTSYVKYVEMGGARAVPIFINRDDEYYKQLFKKVNGILFPGGSVSLDTSGYATAAVILYDLAVQENEKGIYFPLWGTCLGFEMLSQLIANGSFLKNCSAQDIAVPLEMTQGFYRSRLFRSIPPTILNSVITRNVTANFHRRCLPPQNENPNASLWSLIHVLSTNKDINGSSFVSTFEDKRYPFYGVQWHPEKNNFEWTKEEHNIPHDDEAIQVAQYFANFFIREARRNGHKYENITEEEAAVISNYNNQNYYFFHNVTTTMKERYIFFKETQ